MIFDSHVHTLFSADSQMQADDALLTAEKMGLGLVFTEHLDISYPGKQEFTFNPEKYWQTYENLRGKHLRLGVEIGMCTGDEKANRAFAGRVPFDMVIGSIHLLEGRDIYYKDFYEGKSQHDIYREYFLTMAAMLRTHSFVDVLGHIDYIARYAPYAQPALCYGRFSSEIDEVLRVVVETDTVMELNTRRLGNPTVFEELYPIYKRYYELGGRYITIGSDAHNPEAVGTAFSLAVQFIGQCGLIPVTFCKRKLERIM